MHDCPHCGQAYDCDIEDTWLEAPDDCTHECDEYNDEYDPPDFDEEPAQDLGRCCVCMMKGDVRNIIMLNWKSPTPGFGWGCSQCGLPPDGAIAVVCDDCLQGKGMVRFLVAGYPKEDRRVALLDINLESFQHDLSKHPELTKLNWMKGKSR